jgi:hypothetical protein
VGVVVLSEKDILNIILHARQQSHYIDVRPCSCDADREEKERRHTTTTVRIKYLPGWLLHIQNVV